MGLDSHDINCSMSFDGGSQCNCGYEMLNRNNLDKSMLIGINAEYKDRVNQAIKEYESGAKTSGNLPPYECLTREFLRRCAERMRLGTHYGKHNWKKGARDKQFILDRLNHALVHLTKAMEEIDNDITFGEDDLAAVAVNCMFAMEYQYVSPNGEKEASASASPAMEQRKSERG